MSEVFYKKVGRKYVPVSEYDKELSDAYGYGDWLVSVYKGGKTRRRIEPALAPLMAAGRHGLDAMSGAVREATSLRPSSSPITKEQHAAWAHLKEVFGDGAYLLSYNSSYEVAWAGIKAIEHEAAKMMENPSVKMAYEEFMLVYKLAKDQESS